MRPDTYSHFPMLNAQLALHTPGNQRSELSAVLHDCGAGNAAAFIRLHKLVAMRLRRYAMRLTNQHDIVDDIVQESLLAIWRQAAGYEAHLASPMTWMCAIVRHKMFDHFRSQRVRVNADDNFFVDTMYDDNMVNSPCSMLESRQRADEVGRCMQQLLSVQRLAIELAYMHDLTHEEVANKMQKPLGTVKTWIRRGVLDLRRQMSSTTHLSGHRQQVQQAFASAA